MAEPALYSASVPVFVHYLGQARGLVRKVRHQPDVLTRRLVPDMFSGAEQFATAAGFATRISYPLAGRDVPTFAKLGMGYDDLVRRIQRKLTVLGYPVGFIDGKLGPNTLRSISLAQKQMGLNLNASFDPYAINANGRRINVYNINNGGSLFRFTNANFTMNYALSSKDLGKESESGKDYAIGGSADDSGVEEDAKALSVSELLYSSSSYYAIAKPGKLCNFFLVNLVNLENPMDVA